MNLLECSIDVTGSLIDQTPRDMRFTKEKATDEHGNTDDFEIDFVRVFGVHPLRNPSVSVMFFCAFCV